MKKTWFFLFSVFLFGVGIGGMIATHQIRKALVTVKNPQGLGR